MSRRKSNSERGFTLVEMMAVVVITFPWMVRVLVGFTTHIFADFNAIVQQLP